MIQRMLSEGSPPIKELNNVPAGFVGTIAGVMVGMARPPIRVYFRI